MRPDTPPAGQGRTFIEAARRAQLVDCAVDTIAELGYRGASLAAIAQRAGVSKGVISYHFAGKDELMRQVVAEAIAAGDAFVRPWLRAEPTAAGRLRTYLEATIAFLGEHPRQVRALVEIMANARDTAGNPLVDAVVLDPTADRVAAILRDGQDSGEFRRFDPVVLAATVRGALNEVVTRFAADPGLDLAGYAGELVELFGRATRAG